jgi:phosphoribosyl-AMP cyclohydrolase / phosphoribosyl-ATP pyrophosphohydrolase
MTSRRGDGADNEETAVDPAELKWDEKGLIPAVVQDADTGEVLTLAYLSRESLSKTRELGETVFWSRSRGELWHKGATSGNTQKVVGLGTDCDADAVLVRVRPAGPACHTGARSCFFEMVEGFAPPAGADPLTVLRELEAVIAQRKADLPEDSYTARLFRNGRKRILQKVGEEATETILAAMDGNREETVNETADLLFHLLVALNEMGISLEDVCRQLRDRRLGR